MHTSSNTGPIHHWIQALCRVPNAPGKGYFALGKAFAGCSTRQRASVKKLVGKDFFAGCFLSGTRQRLCRVQTRHPAKKSGRYLRHPLLCRVPCQRHPAKIFLIFFQIFFAGCRAGEAPGKDVFIFFIISLPGVSPRGHPAKSFFIFFRNFFAGCQVMGHPAKIFFLKKLCRVPWT